MMPVLDNCPLLVTPETELSTVLLWMSQRQSGNAHEQSRVQECNAIRSDYAIIAENRKPVGILTEGDVVKLTAQGIYPAAVCVAEVMTRQLVTITEDDLDNESLVWTISRQHGIHHIPVLDFQGNIVSVVVLDVYQAVRTLRQQITYLLNERDTLLERVQQSQTFQISEQEKQFRLIFEQAATGIATINFQGDFCRVNERWCEIFGYTQLELLNKNALDLTHPDYQAKTVAGLNQLIQGESESVTYDKLCLRFDGSTVWLHVTISRVDASDKSYLVVVAEDISDRKRLELELEKHHNHLE
ncbi:MAG: PAS domain S-box protein, partial [Cyanobacteria bacterium P01_D01_bin.56]